MRVIPGRRRPRHPTVALPRIALRRFPRDAGLCSRMRPLLLGEGEARCAREAPPGEICALCAEELETQVRPALQEAERLIRLMELARVGAEKGVLRWRD